MRGVVNNSGAVLEHRHFDPFGGLASGAMSQTDYGFTGEPFDATSGLLYLRARHYRPSGWTYNLLNHITNSGYTDNIVRQRGCGDKQ